MRHYATNITNKGRSSQGYGFSSSHVWMWELDCKESWALKNWYFWTVVLARTLDSLLDYKEIQPVNPNQPWIFIGRTEVEAETPVVWPPDVKNQLIGKDPGAGKDWRPEEKGTTEDKMVGWHHWCDGSEVDMTWVWDLEIDREAWNDSILGFAKSWPWLSDWTDLK